MSSLYLFLLLGGKKKAPLVAARLLLFPTLVVGPSGDFAVPQEKLHLKMSASEY